MRMFSHTKTKIIPVMISVYTADGTFLESVDRKERWGIDGFRFVIYNNRKYRVYAGYPSPLKQFVADPHIVIENEDTFKF